MDPVAVEAAAARSTVAIRAGEGPRFLECRTYRFRAHSMFDPELYRDKTEVEAWKKRDPIVRLSDWMRELGILHPADIDALEKEIAVEIAQAVAFAEQGAWEPAEDLTKDVYAEAPA
jgi:TPP-dependent pyruvate/acetoin dehydrogenase alpha subunit